MMMIIPLAPSLLDVIGEDDFDPTDFGDSHALTIPVFKNRRRSARMDSVFMVSVQRGEPGLRPHADASFPRL